ncbi:hypothetical protein ECP02994833_2146, partial [Escherichia coli P0299483.3]
MPNYKKQYIVESNFHISFSFSFNHYLKSSDYN